ncbi:Leucyl aminopeptidase (aminopeptidase T) [Fictibacillus solisalsi]|uniref:Leucyl aminopeptidase (Aminopeptidase T) n=1 Tax=Fictibacillus solisalsi TaxID=459525 RepID=A0A1H0BTA6_9BACL|nr:aminopeptidase [Fictibacillus solisalsi]SDN48806.1 Leucyl aminopeptidase (aminopeptidase T) [Fictibacillus solisalsi]
MQNVAHTAVHESLQIKRGDKIYIYSIGDSNLVDEIIQKVQEVGATVYLNQLSISNWKTIVKFSTARTYRGLLKKELRLLQEMNGFIGLTTDENLYELKDVSAESLKVYYKYFYEPLLLTAQSLSKWLLLHPPSTALAQLSSQSLEQLNHIFNDAVGLLEHNRYYPLFKEMMNLLEETDQVHIKTPLTDLRFSIKGVNPSMCMGKHNLPGGEVYTAPIPSSVNGYITFNIPFHSFGTAFETIQLFYCNGSLEYYVTSDDTHFQQIIQSDFGASIFGEFGIGLNPFIVRPVYTSAYDEKMAGTIHLALGQSYKSSYNGNDSTVHMDLVLSLLKEDGGGCLFFDEVLFMKDGKIVHPRLQRLIPLT